MHHRNPGVRVKVQLPLKLSVENAEYLEETYGGDYKGYGHWVFSRVTEESWKDFEHDLAKMHGEIIQILKANPLGEYLVVAGANPAKSRRKEAVRLLEEYGSATSILDSVLEEELRVRVNEIEDSPDLGSPESIEELVVVLGRVRRATKILRGKA